MSPQPRQGAVFDVGDAVALFWEDIHPCGPLRNEPVLVLTPSGGTQWTDRMRPGARFLGMLPGMGGDESEIRQGPVLLGDGVSTLPPQIHPDSWLNGPDHVEFVDAFRHAAAHYPGVARILGRMTPEDAYSLFTGIGRGFQATARRRTGRGEVSG